MKKIILYGGKEALVDDNDFKKINRYKWVLDSHGYAVRKVYMHRFIMGEGDMFVDHKNLNKLDNRKSNLRFCNRFQSQSNRGLQNNNKSGYRGVSWNKKSKKWHVAIKHLGITHELGFYDDKNEAATIYNKESIKLNGDFARLNII